VFEIIRLLLWLLIILLFAYSILSWIAPNSPYDSPVRRVEAILGRVCEPILRPVRKIIPPARVGGASVDFSVLIVLLVVELVLIPLFH
jgi:YggT family protein